MNNEYELEQKWREGWAAGAQHAIATGFVEEKRLEQARREARHEAVQDVIRMLQDRANYFLEDDGWPF